MFKCVFQAPYGSYTLGTKPKMENLAPSVRKCNKAEKVSCLQAADIFQMLSVRCMLAVFQMNVIPLKEIKSSTSD